MRRIVVGLRARLLIIVVLALFPALVLAVVTALDRRDADRGQGESQVTRAIQMASFSRRRLAETTEGMLAVLARLPQLRDVASCNALLPAIGDGLPRYNILGVADAAGNVYCTSYRSAWQPTNVADRPYFRDAVDAQRFSSGDYQVGRITGEPGISFGYPVRDESGRVVAVAYAALDLGFLRMGLQELPLAANTALLLLDSRGTVILSTDPAAFEPGSSLAGTTLFQLAVRRHDGAVESDEPDGVSRLWDGSQLGGAEESETAFVLAGVPTSVIFGSADTMLRRTLTGMTAAAVFVLALTWLGGELFIGRPTRALTTTAEKLSAGDYSARTGLSESRDELGRLAVAFDNLAKELEARSRRLGAAYEGTLFGWARALELRDFETSGHSHRVTEMTVRLATAFDLSGTQLELVRYGALLHDIGKMAIPDEILLKPGPLSEDEWEVMRRHPVYAKQLLETIEFLRPAIDIPLYHHERWDGGGYPTGIAGPAIPLGARIFAVVDVYDALTSVRPYKEAWEPERAVEHVRLLAGSHFDPEIVEVFLKAEMWQGLPLAA